MTGMVRGLLGPMALALYVRPEYLVVAALTSLLMALLGADRTEGRRLVLLAVLGASLSLIAGQMKLEGLQSLLTALSLYALSLVICWPLGDRIIQVLTPVHPQVRGRA